MKASSVSDRPEHRRRYHRLRRENAEGNGQDHSTEGAEDRDPQRFRAALLDLGHHRRVRRKHPTEEIGNARAGRHETRQLDIGRGEGPQDRGGDQTTRRKAAKPAERHQDTALRPIPGIGSTAR